MSLPTLSDAWTGRRRAWLLTGCAALLVLTYLVGWTAYAANGLTALGRLDQLPPGASGTALGAEYRLLGLTATEEIRDQENAAESEIAGADASWVVAEIEVVRRREVKDYYCVFELLGPDRRRWDPTRPSSVQRTLPSSCNAEELPLGRPARIEVIFSVPSRFLDQIYGIAVPDVSTREPTPVLRPAG